MTSIGKNGVAGGSGAPEKEAPAPAEQTWESRFKAGVSEFQEWFRAREVKKISKDQMDRKRIVAAHKAIHKAEETKRFLAGEFWTEHLLPELSGDQAAKPWRPGDPRSLEQYAMEQLVASGKAERANGLLAAFQTWIRAGDDARKALAEEAERAAKVKALRG